MAKDYTDYVLMVLGSGDRVYHLKHARQIKGKLIFDHSPSIRRKLKHKVYHPVTDQPLKSFKDGDIYRKNDQNYLLNLDRAYRINWAPWKKLVIRKPYWRYFYQPLIELTRSKKVGLLFYQEYCAQDCKIRCPGDKPCTCPEFIEPMHISRIHQPSGVMKG